MSISFIKNVIEAYCYDKLGYEMCSFNEDSRPKNKQKRFMVTVNFRTPDTYGEGVKSKFYCSEWAATKAQAYETLYGKVFVMAR